jgi:isocitrate dehydrogenase kinase/phosphatase
MFTGWRWRVCAASDRRQPKKKYPLVIEHGRGTYSLVEDLPLSKAVFRGGFWFTRWYFMVSIPIPPARWDRVDEDQWNMQVQSWSFS